MKIDNKESKQRFSLYTYESTLDKAADFAKKQNCSPSEFIAEAIDFYTGFLSNQNDTVFLPNAVEDAMKRVLDPITRRQGSLLFKVALELCMLMNVVAAREKIDSTTLDRVRGVCAQEVKKINGIISLEDAARWQE